MERRQFLRYGGIGAALALGTPVLSACKPVFSQLPFELDGPVTGYGPLLDPNADGLRLPAGFSSRIVATSGQPVAGTTFTWPAAPDGGACFRLSDGGWVYVANSEVSSGGGGASMLRFAPDGTITAAKAICTGTSRNCAGGGTPWGTWLTCEEVANGLVWECDPLGNRAATSRPAMGAFNHEAACVDPVGQTVYLSEDRTDGALYRSVPTTWPDLSAGVLQVLTDVAGALSWATVPDPDGAPTATRYQVAGTRTFNGGEGLALDGRTLYLATKGDNRVWALDVDAVALTVVYDDDTATPASLTGVDNVTGGHGALLVAEDGGDMQLVMVGPDGSNAPVVQVTDTPGSEVTGPAFSPDGTRLYFSSQRTPGRTYEVTGPW